MNAWAASIAVLIARTAAAQAALPPEFQRSRELVAVIQAAALAFDRHEIHQVTHVGDMLYRVDAGPCSLNAAIVPKPEPEAVGAMEFTVSLSAVSCRSE